MRFTKDKAIEICTRRLPVRPYSIDCYHCYYHDGRCELGINNPQINCIHFRSDITYTNLVRNAIVAKPQWCRDNWSRMCHVDKELFNIIHQREDNMKKVKYNCECQKDLDEMRLSLIKMLFNDDVVLLSYSKEADECNSEINVELTFKVV